MCRMKRKAGQPEAALLGAPSPAQDREGEALLRVYLRAMGLKRLFRQGWLKRGLPEAACESVADHSFGTALLALFLAGRPPHEGLRREKAVLMALVHELCEVYAGDITPADGVPPEEKARLERESLARVLDGLPEAAELVALWEEFEAGQSPEARLVKQLDRLEMGLQAAVYRAEGAPRMEEFLESADRAVGDRDLRALLALAAGAGSAGAATGAGAGAPAAAGADWAGGTGATAAAGADCAGTPGAGASAGAETGGAGRRQAPRPDPLQE